VKFATTDLSEFIIIDLGFSVPDKSPDQEEKIYPELGVAVKLTDVPLAYDPEDGLTEP
jgi:hypothetical protein